MRPNLLFCPIFYLLLTGIVSAQDRSSSVPASSAIPCNQRSFSIPFDVRSDGGADPPKEIELLYSSDRGTRWFSVKRVPVDVKKFEFTAPDDGEYWFVFRTITVSGQIKATNFSGPQLRVLVDTTLPDAKISGLSGSSATAPVATTVPSATSATVPVAATGPTTVPGNASRSFDSLNLSPVRESSAVPLTPPKPVRMQVRNEPMKKKNESDVPASLPQRQTLPSLFSPSGEAVPFQPTPTTTEKKRPAVDPMFAEMIRSYEQGTTNNESQITNSESRTTNRIPAPAVAVANSTVAANRAVSESEAERSTVPGSISGVSLGNVSNQPRVVVRWNTGDESWRTAYVDVLRGASPQGPWLPIATNLPNNGEYWWFVTNDDFKPFYVSVRLRAPSGASTADATRSPIRIDPAMFR